MGNRKKNNKRKKNRKKNKAKQNGQIRTDTEVVSTTLDLTSGRFPARKTKTPSISRDSILTIDDFESADNQSDKATDKDDDSLETANEEASLKEKDRQDKKDPVAQEQPSESLSSSEHPESLTTTTTTKRPRPKKQGNRKRNKQRKKQKKKKKKA